MKRTADSEPVKVLVSGDVEGEFEVLFKRIDAITKKVGKFDLLLCVGEFFGDSLERNQAFLNSEITPPLPTYILGPCKEATVAAYGRNRELTAHLTYLGKQGLLYTPSGLTVAYLSGRETSASPAEFEFDRDSVRQLLVPTTASLDFAGVDILLTAGWPLGVANFAAAPPAAEVEGGSPLAARLAAVLRPRYHFAGLADTHYERQPYRNHMVLQEGAQHVTRYIGLAKVNNAKKAKFLYAFNIVPMKHLARLELTKQPPDASEFPYGETLRDLADKERELEEKSGKTARQYFFDENAGDALDDGDNRESRRGQKRGNRTEGEGVDEKKQPLAPCWFCLSSPDVEKHLVCSVGDSTYLAMAKGGLTEQHVLILPIGHIQSLVAAPEDVRMEIARFKTALTKCFEAAARAVVFFERNYRTQHLQIQAVPVPQQSVGKLRNAMDKTALVRGLELVEIPDGDDIWDVVNEGCPYFYAELPDGCKLFTRQMKNFPIQFGREVLASASVLNMPDRIDWRACSLRKDEESENAQLFRKLFANFDFTNE